MLLPGSRLPLNSRLTASVYSSAPVFITLPVIASFNKKTAARETIKATVTTRAYFRLLEPSCHSFCGLLILLFPFHALWLAISLFFCVFFFSYACSCIHSPALQL